MCHANEVADEDKGMRKVSTKCGRISRGREWKKLS